MPGPLRAPTALLALSGSWRAKARTATEPVAVPGVPDAPQDLVDDELEAYRYLAEACAPGVVTMADGPALAQLARLFAMHRRLWDEGRATPIITSHGQDVPNACVSLALKIGDRIDKGLASFGLTPAARARLVIPPAPVRDTLEDFLNDHD